jgi:hypothetical protein
MDPITGLAQSRQNKIDLPRACPAPESRLAPSGDTASGRREPFDELRVNSAKHLEFGVGDPETLSRP